MLGLLSHDLFIFSGPVLFADEVSSILASIGHEEKDMDRRKEADNKYAGQATKVSRGRVADKISETHCEIQDALSDDFCEQLHVVCEV